MPLDNTAQAGAVHVNEADFDAQVLGADLPVLVDFWAPWCSPCRAIAPHVDTLASQVEGKAKVIKVNIDDNAQLAARFGIRSIPNLLVFKGGKVVDQLVGNPGSGRPIEQLLHRHVD